MKLLYLSYYNNVIDYDSYTEYDFKQKIDKHAFVLSAYYFLIARSRRSKRKKYRQTNMRQRLVHNSGTGITI